MVKGSTLGDDIGYGQFSKGYILLLKLLRMKVLCHVVLSVCVQFGTRGHELNFVFSPFNLEAKSSLVDYHTKQLKVGY